jgi:two-component system, chemotaxis family, response regulator Rcp1
MNNLLFSGAPIEILLVEDSLADIELTKLGLREGKIANHLSVARDGEEAIQFLRREGLFAEAPRPDLILLDLNLPGKDGREVLDDIKCDEDLKRIPVVILTTSQAEEDVMRAYGLHANAYMTKPVEFDRFVGVVRGISDYWFTLAKLPPRQ